MRWRVRAFPAGAAARCRVGIIGIKARSAACERPRAVLGRHVDTWRDVHEESGLVALEYLAGPASETRVSGRRAQIDAGSLDLPTAILGCDNAASSP